MGLGHGQILAGGNCGENDCPTIVSVGDGMVEVQGYHQQYARTPAGETVALIPAVLIIEAARVLSGHCGGNA
ncbi:MAG TPA: hypothetical protein VKU39_04660 [Streptosporangiaceae bacterium]|nr:hypothetical protein [Streptosporangiaceae bacterium]